MASLEIWYEDKPETERANESRATDLKRTTIAKNDSKGVKKNRGNDCEVGESERRALGRSDWKAPVQRASEKTAKIIFVASSRQDATRARWEIDRVTIAF